MNRVSSLTPHSTKLTTMILLTVGCASTKTDVAEAQRQFMAGQEEAFAMLQRSGIEIVRMIGPFQRPVVQWNPSLTLTETILAAGYLDTRDPMLPGIRPENSMTAALTRRFLDDRLRVQLNVQHVDDRQKTPFDPGPAKLDPYTVVNLAANWQVHEHLRLMGRVHNLGNTNYEVVRNFATHGRSFFLGVELQF